MGTVYLALDRLIERQVAIKEIKVDEDLSDAERKELRGRFETEFRTAGKLSHPNVATVFDVGQGSGTYFIAMEYVPGTSLGQRLRQEPALTMAEILRLTEQIADGLDHAHAHGIVHRDVKPANVLLTGDGRVKVVDFGIAKVSTSNLTVTGTVLGTPAYMSPEQVAGKQVTGKSDQFSLAVMLYRMLTGEQPFRGDNPSSVLYQIVHDTPEPTHQHNPNLPKAVNAVLLRGMAKAPSDRFDNCRALVVALADALGSPLASRPEAAQAKEYDNEPTSRMDLPLRPRRRVWVGIAAVLLLLLAVWAGLAWFGPPGGDARESRATATGIRVQAEYDVTVRAAGKTFGPGRNPVVELPPGEHNIQLEASDVFLKETFTVRVGEGPLALFPAPPLVDILIETDPAGARVGIEDNNLGPAPLSLRVVEGEHFLSFFWSESETTETYTWKVSSQSRHLLMTPDGPLGDGGSGQP